MAVKFASRNRIIVRQGRTVIISYPGGARVVMKYPSWWRAVKAYRFIANR